MLQSESDTNPTPEEIFELVKAARASGASSKVRGKNEGLGNLGQLRMENDKKTVSEFLVSNTNNDGGYPGFYPDDDKTACAVMTEIGCTPTPTDIIVVPSTAGMALEPGTNPAVALMTEDKVALFRKIAITDHGLGKFADGPPPDYRALVERFQIGTIVIAKSLMNDELKLKGTIWHECGHKLLNNAEEAGEVFFLEISKIKDTFGRERACEWATDVGRKPQYHRTYGLAKDPGRKDLLLLLREICPERLFYDEFRKQYEEIMGEVLRPSTQLAEKLTQEKEERDAARKPVGVGTVITGDLAALQAQVPEADIAGSAGLVRPVSAQVGSTVTFAGKMWQVQDKKTKADKAVFTLECTATTIAATITQIGEIWEQSAAGTKSYGLSEQGPWLYTRQLDASNDARLVETITLQVLDVFTSADHQTVRRLVRAQVEETAGAK